MDLKTIQVEFLYINKNKNCLIISGNRLVRRIVGKTITGSTSVHGVTVMRSARRHRITAHRVHHVHVTATHVHIAAHVHVMAHAHVHRR